MEVKNNNYYISTSFSLLDINAIWLLLKDCFWTKNIPIDYVKKFVQHSLCFGVYEKKSNILLGFGRIITDYTTYAYVCDVVINKKHRGKGLANSLIKAMLEYPELKGLKTWSLRITSESERIYKKYGFKIADSPETIYEINDLNIYQKC